SNGRIYKVQAAGAKPPAKFDLAKLTSAELVELLKHPNGWYADRARVLLAGRRDRSTWPALRALARQQADPRLALKGLWALHAADPVIAWLLWWAVEGKAVSDHERVTAFFAELLARANPPRGRGAGAEINGRIRANVARLVRRYAAEGTAVGYRAASVLLRAAP